MTEVWELLGKGVPLLVTPFIGAWLGARVGIWKRRQERLDDLQEAAIAAAAQMKAGMWLGRPNVNDNSLLVTEDERREFVTTAAKKNAEEVLKRQTDYRSALAALEPAMPELRKYWDKRSIEEDDTEAVIRLLRKRRLRWSLRRD